MLYIKLFSLLLSLMISAGAPHAPGDDSPARVEFIRARVTDDSGAGRVLWESSGAVDPVYNYIGYPGARAGDEFITILITRGEDDILFRRDIKTGEAGSMRYYRIKSTCDGAPALLYTRSGIQVSGTFSAGELLTSTEFRRFACLHLVETVHIKKSMTERRAGKRFAIEEV